jgi:kynurenine formamidase
MSARHAVVIGIAAALAVQPGLAAEVDHTVTQAQFDQWKQELSNWGRWGKDDDRGTLNLITPAKSKAAAALVKDGVTISLARDTDSEKSADNTSPFEHTMNPIGPSSSTDRIAVNFHGYAVTHFDALGHHFLNGRMYNGFPAKEYVTPQEGAKKGSVMTAENGIVTRGVLVDIPRLKGVAYLEPGTPIYAEDIEAWEKMAGVKIQPGDAVFIRTGRWTRRKQTGPWNVAQQAAGLDASIIPWIKQHDIALLGSESALSVTPIPKSSQITNADDYLPVHNFVLVALGMNLIDNCDLDALAQAAAERKRWEFLFTVAPLRVVNGTGSPVNPIAVF